MAQWEALDASVSAAGIKFGAPTLGQTTGGAHVKFSAHYEGRARDYGTSNSNAQAIFDHFLPFAQGDNAPIQELFYRDQAWKNGKKIGAIAGHYDHVHVAIREGATLSGVPTGGAAPDSGSSSSSIGNSLKTLMDPETAKRVLKVVCGFIATAMGLSVLLSGVGLKVLSNA